MGSDEPTIGVLVMRIARQLRIRFDGRAKELDLTRAQWQTIACVRRNPGATQRELAEMLEVGEATAGRSVDRLVRAGLIERRNDPDDRRSNKVYPTPALLPIVSRLMEIGNDEESVALRDFTPGDSLLFREMLERISRNLTDT